MWHFRDSLLDEFRVHVQATSNRGRSHLRWDTAKGREVKKILLTTTAFLALGMAPAIAADLGARPYTKVPSAIAMYNWLLCRR